MSNRIRDIVVRDHRLDPAESEVWITVEPEEWTETTRVGGRLMGPRCPYSSTVEVAYPLRPWKREQGEDDTENLTMRVIIPEASLWEPETPFLYQGPVELWQGEQLCERIQLSHGLRVITLGPRGIRVNGRPFTVEAVRGDGFSEGELLRLREAGCNSLLTSVTARTLYLWEAADRLGFLMLGRIVDRETWELAGTLRQHPSCLGWVITSELVNHEILQAVRFSPLSFGRSHLVGCEINPLSLGPLPDGLQFMVCDEALLPLLVNHPQPKIVLADREFDELQAPDVLGWVFTGLAEQ
jgi:Glycosyl hydrolases family 2